MRGDPTPWGWDQRTVRWLAALVTLAALALLWRNWEADGPPKRLSREAMQRGYEASQRKPPGSPRGQGVGRRRTDPAGRH